MIWLNFQTKINKQYVEMLACIGGTTLTQDGYAAYHTVAKEYTLALAKSIICYAKQSARVDTRVGEPEACLEAMSINSQPLGLGLPSQGVKYAHEAMRAPPGFFNQQEYEGRRLEALALRKNY